MLAEFGYDGKILETFPFDQRVPSRLMFYLKMYGMPFIYWKLFLRLRTVFIVCFFGGSMLSVVLRPYIHIGGFGARGAGSLEKM